MVDPQRRTSTADDNGYKQLVYEPILGGGLITALSVPLITEFGLPAFTIAGFVLLLVVGVWGMRRGAHTTAPGS
jgi:ESS family glutamate:Na+ symporter